MYIGDEYWQNQHICNWKASLSKHSRLAVRTVLRLFNSMSERLGRGLGPLLPIPASEAARNDLNRCQPWGTPRLGLGLLGSELTFV